MNNMTSIINKLRKIYGYTDYQTYIRYFCEDLNYALDIFDFCELCKIHNKGEYYSQQCVLDLIKSILKNNKTYVIKYVEQRDYNSAVDYFMS